jgi:hypothetical protein
VEFLLGYMMGLSQSHDCGCQPISQLDNRQQYDNDLEIKSVIKNDIRTLPIEGGYSHVYCVSEVEVKSKYANRHMISYTGILKDVGDIKIEIQGKRGLSYFSGDKLIATTYI